MQLAGDIVRYISILAALVFVINYSKFPWYKSMEGIFLMGFAGISVGYFSLVTVVRIFGRFEYYDLVSLIFFGMVATLLLLLNYIAFKAYRKVKKETLDECDRIRSEGSQP